MLKINPSTSVPMLFPAGHRWFLLSIISSLHCLGAHTHTHTLLHKCSIYRTFSAHSDTLMMGSHSHAGRHTHTYTHTHTHTQVQCLKVTLTVAVAATSAICLIHHSSHFPLLKFNLSSYNPTLFSLMYLWIVFFDVSFLPCIVVCGLFGYIVVALTLSSIMSMRELILAQICFHVMLWFCFDADSATLWRKLSFFLNDWYVTHRQTRLVCWVNCTVCAVYWVCLCTECSFCVS